MRILIVKLSSLGDVIHTLPVLADIQRHFPSAQIDWVVEPSFASLLSAHPLVQRVIECPLRMWLKNHFDAPSRAMAKAFWHNLRQTAYDYVFDLQGLSKSALIAKCARLTTKGQRVAMANRTDGSSYEPLTRWLSTKAIALPVHIDAVARGRMLCARALNYVQPSTLDFGFVAKGASDSLGALNPASDGGWSKAQGPQVLLIHGTSRADKAWPLSHWVELSERLMRTGHGVCVTYASQEELAFVQSLMAQVKGIELWPQQSLGQLYESMQSLQGAIGVDSGVSHLAVALNLVHVQIYNFPTHWRTGPLYHSHQVSVFASPTPSVDDVWSAWLQALQSPRSQA